MRSFARARFEVGRQIGSAYLGKWHEARQHADTEYDRAGEEKSSRVGQQRSAFRTGEEERAQYSRSPHGDDQAGEAAKECEQYPFGEQLAEQPSPAHAERGANGNLPAPANGAGQEQVGNVGAGDEQHDQGDPGQPRGGSRYARWLRTAFRQHRGGDGSRPKFGERHGVRSPDILSLVAPSQRVRQVGARRVHCDTRLPPDDDFEPECGAVGRRPLRSAAAGGIRRDRDERGRRLVRPETDEPIGCDADDRVGDRVDLEGPSQHVVTRAELRLPQSPAQHRDGRGRGRRVLAGSEVPSDDWWRVEESKETGADDRDAAQLGVIPHTDCERLARDAGCLRERRRVVGEVDVARIDAARFALHAAARSIQVDAVHRCGIDHARGRAEEQVIDEREHRGVRADPERERERHADREDRIAAQVAESVRRILPQCIERRRKPDGARFLAHEGLVAHRAAGLRPCVHRR